MGHAPITRPELNVGELARGGCPALRGTNINKKGRNCALAHTSRTVRGNIDQRKVESECIGGRIWISLITDSLYIIL